METFIY